jgi:hypothetical protein
LQNVRRALVVIAILTFVLAGPANAARISSADRQEINRTVDAFVNSAVKRQHEEASWNVVTPSFRYGVSRSAWAKGNLPVYPYPARGTTFHSWTVDSASPTVVDFELMVPSRLSKTDSIQFQGEVKKIHGRWLINSFNPAATFAGGGTVVGPHDFTASSGGGGKGVARLGSTWIALPAALIGAGLVLVLCWFGLVWVRSRRAYRRVEQRPLEPIVVKRRDSEPALVPKERREADG